MPKKFRRISLILALALIVSAIFPGVNVQAATMSLSKTTIRLYVGGDSLTNYGKTYTLSVKNKNSAYHILHRLLHINRAYTKQTHIIPRRKDQLFRTAFFCNNTKK